MLRFLADKVYYSPIGYNNNFSHNYAVAYVALISSFLFLVIP